ncbi:MAG: ATP-binding protein, partial [Limisphaerales bacterium]
ISIIMVTSATVLFLTCAFFLIYELATFRRGIEDNLNTLAQVVGRNSTAALAFRDQGDAQEVLSALAAERHILAAALFDQEGNLFASYSRQPQETALPSRLGPPGFDYRQDSLTLVKAVRADADLGFIYIESDLRIFSERLQRYVIIVLLVILISLLVAFGLSNAMERRISTPLLHLSQAARKVTKEKNYRIRAPKHGGDELGQLTDAFNEMLEQIYLRDEALQEKEERLRLALDASQIAIWHHNLLTGERMWDSQMQRLFGFQPGEYDGTAEAALNRIHPEDREYVIQTISKALDKRREFTLEYRLVWPNGNLRYITARGKAVYSDAGQPLHLTGVAMDITEDKLAEAALRESEERYRRLSAELDERVKARTAELEATNAELEAFTYTVSHDLRAPLRHMTAYSQLLLEDHADKLDTDAKRFLARIRLSARNMGQLVDDLLNLSRIGRQELKCEIVPLKDIVQRAIHSLSPDTENRAIEWRIQPLPIAECDAGLMQQVFVNILSNAVKYTRKREQAVIEVGQMEQANETIIFVRDNGVGFNMQYISKLFGVFERLHRQEDFEGTGVGLASVERIIRKHHGRIWAEAEEGKGATFYFTFPGIKRR